MYVCQHFQTSGPIEAKFHVEPLWDGETKVCSNGEGFLYYVLAWWPSWSCDRDHLNKLSFPHPAEVPHEIWLQSASQFLRKKSLKILILSDLGPRSINNHDL